MKRLLEKMKPEFKDMISDKDDSFYNDAINSLENKYWNRVDLSGFIAITHFTHPERMATIVEFIEMFND